MADRYPDKCRKRGTAVQGVVCSCNAARITPCTVVPLFLHLPGYLSASAGVGENVEKVDAHVLTGMWIRGMIQL